MYRQLERISPTVSMSKFSGALINRRKMRSTIVNRRSVFFACPKQGPNGIEWDTMEQYHPGAAATTVHDPCAGPGVAGGNYWNDQNAAPSVGTYHTLGTVQSSDGSTTMSFVTYLDSTKMSSQAFTPGSSSDYTSREEWGLGIGDQNKYLPNTPGNNMDMYIQHISYWVLPGCAWQSNQCNGAIYR